ncbi:FMN-dependent NADH-azoreductase [Amnibacterium kyonggiense]
MRVLNIVSSPRGDRSASVAVADAFFEALRVRHPDVQVDTLDVWAEALPEFDERASSAKYKAARGGDLDEAERAVWATIRGLADRFRLADRIVVGVPMWNWAYPYKLKQLIDLVTHRGLLFEVKGDTIGPSLDVPLGIAFLVRGQAYPEWGGRPPKEFDHQSSYIDFWLRLIGVREVRTLVVEHTWGDLAGPAVEWGRAQARAMAADF